MDGQLSFYLTGIAIGLVGGCIAGCIADSKGYSFGGWFLYGFLIPIIAIPHAALKRTTPELARARALDSGAMKLCPACKEAIDTTATRCRHCTTAIDAGAGSGVPA